MSFRDTLAFDAVNTFLPDFGEPIVYTSYGQAPLQILAIVNRNAASAIPGLTGSANYKHEIMIANDPTAGKTTINKGKDTVVLNNQIGGTTETFVVMQILQQDEGIFHLGVG